MIVIPKFLLTELTLLSIVSITSTETQVVSSATKDNIVAPSKIQDISSGSQGSAVETLQKEIMKSSDAGTKVEVLVRRHGDFDNEEYETTQNPLIEATTGTVTDGGTMKSVQTEVLFSGENDREGECDGGSGGRKGPLMRLPRDSKFFADSVNTYTHKEAKELCDRYGLVLAELENVGDHRSLQNFVSGFGVTKTYNKQFFIGMNDIEIEGVFVHGNGNDLAFQNFLLSQPDDKNQTEDCVVLMRETNGGPVGAADVDCDTPAHVLCMFQNGTDCYKDSKENQENLEIALNRGLISIRNSTTMRHYVSNFQLTWNRAMRYCLKKNMSLFTMDEEVTMSFFNKLLKWETDLVRAPSPALQFWTAGRFKGTHMNAPIMWATRPLATSSSEEIQFTAEDEGYFLRDANFTWSGVYRWSSQKSVDPGGPHGYRRDVCVSFGFESNPQTEPYIRNTNCDLPAYFICAQRMHLKETDY